MKYVIIRDTDGGEFPFLFCAPFTHVEVALMLQGHRHGRTIIAAGFVDFSGSTPRCFGRSESLNIDSRPSLDSAHLGAFYQATLASARALYAA